MVNYPVLLMQIEVIYNLNIDIFHLTLHIKRKLRNITQWEGIIYNSYRLIINTNHHRPVKPIFSSFKNTNHHLT